MADQTTRRATYTTDTFEEQILCEPWPRITVQLVETITTTTRHPDGSTTVHETQPRVVQTWTHQHKETH